MPAQNRDLANCYVTLAMHTARTPRAGKLDQRLRALAAEWIPGRDAAVPVVRVCTWHLATGTLATCHAQAGQGAQPAGTSAYRTMLFVFVCKKQKAKGWCILYWQEIGAKTQEPGVFPKIEHPELAPNKEMLF